MNDVDIIKALELVPHCNVYSGECKKCPYRWVDDCATKFPKDALDLINRQKAGIEKKDEAFAEVLSTSMKRADVIAKQNAEIERLHNILLAFTNQVHTWSNKKGYDTTELSLIPILNEAESVREAIKTEAIIEFAERLHKTIDDFRDRREMVMLPYTESALCVIEKKIDQIAEKLKEGVNNA